jgi:hypothetical protein
MDKECPWTAQQLGWLYRCGLLDGVHVNQRIMVTKKSYEKLKNWRGTLLNPERNKIARL